MAGAGPGPLALIGGDELKPGNEPQDRMLVEAAGTGPAFVLATAAGRQHPEQAVANAVRWFGTLGLQVRELPATRRSDATAAANVARARAGGFFYLVGGDPGLVPKTLAGTPLWESIWGEHLHHGYYGGDGEGRKDPLQAQVDLVEALLHAHAWIMTAGRPPSRANIAKGSSGSTSSSVGAGR